MIFRKLGSGDFADCREHVSKLDKVIHHAPGLSDAGRPVDDERNTRTGVAHRALASHDLFTVPRGDDRCVRAVVAGEDDQRVVPHAGLLELRHDLPDRLVGIGHHVAEVALRVVAVALVSRGAKPLGIPVGGVGRGIEGAVREDHRIVYEERFLFVFIDEIADEIGAYLRAVFAVVEILLHTAELQLRIDEAAVDIFTVLIRSAAAGVLPEAGLLEAKVLWRIFVAPELPFTSNGGGVSGRLELMGEGGLLASQPAERHVIADVVLAGHKLNPRRRADGIGETVGEAHALRGQLVEVGRLAGFTTVGRQRLIAHVVGHDENDIGLVIGLRCERAQQEAHEDGESRCKFHG